MIGATLIIGILIGALGVGLWGNQSRRGGKASAGGRQGSKEVLMQRIIKEVEADSLQAKQMKPLMLETVANIDSLQMETDKKVRAVLVSFEEKLVPILRADQLKKLQEFHRRMAKRKEVK